MKFLSVVLLLTAFVYVKCDGFNKEEFLSVINECRTKTNAGDLDIASLMNHLPAATNEGKCLRACVLKKMGVVDQDNKFNKEVALQVIKNIASDNDNKDKLTGEIVDTCADLKVADDECEAGEQRVQCIIHGAETRQLDIKTKMQ